MGGFEKFDMPPFSSGMAPVQWTVGWLVGVNTRGPQGPLVLKVTSEVEGHNSLASLVLRAQLLLLIWLIL